MSGNYICCVCGKPATVCKRETINGVTKEHYYCDECFALVESGHPLENLLSAMFNFGGSSLGMGGMPRKMRVCQCGMTERDVLNKGKFGCSECYNVFRDIADNYVSKRGHLAHKGKVPAKSAPQNVATSNTQTVASNSNAKAVSALDKLKADLAAAVKDERFLDANAIKLKIAELEKGGK